MACPSGNGGEAFAPRFFLTQWNLSGVHHIWFLSHTSYKLRVLPSLKRSRYIGSLHSCIFEERGFCIHDIADAYGQLGEPLPQLVYQMAESVQPCFSVSYWCLLRIMSKCSRWCHGEYDLWNNSSILRLWSCLLFFRELPDMVYSRSCQFNGSVVEWFSQLSEQFRIFLALLFS